MCEAAQGHRKPPLIRTQALGESFEVEKLQALGRYEVHLDRKFERTLTILIRLQAARGSTEPG